MIYLHIYSVIDRISQSRKLLGTVPLGGSCGSSSQCIDYTGSNNPGDVLCCQGKCEKLLKDWLGLGFCPHQCVGFIFDNPGSCSLAGEECNNGNCGEGYCCSNVCRIRKLDWANTCHCPDACVGSPGGSPGSCSNRPDC